MTAAHVDGVLAEDGTPLPTPDDYGAVDPTDHPLAVNGSAARDSAPLYEYDDAEVSEDMPSNGDDMDDSIPDDVLDAIATQQSGDDQSHAGNGARRTGTPLKVIDAGELLSAKAPPREWLVDPLIPKGEVTLLGGDGGTGKSTLLLQLGAACSAGGRWLDRETTCCPVLYVSAEDDERELHHRLEPIVTALGSAPLASFNLIDLAGKDAVLARFDRNGTIRPTELFAMIDRVATDLQVGCIIIDAAADVFGGNEIDRSQVRAFINLHQGLALRLNAAVVLAAHPSIDGLKSGRGYSGSTAWSNSVRSRLNLTYAPAENEDEEPDADCRVLRLLKANRTRPGWKIDLKWHRGRFVVDGDAASSTDRLSAADDKDDDLFLALLQKFAEQGRPVSPNKSQSFAGMLFARCPDAGGVGQKRFERAQDRLLSAGKIEIVKHGPPSRQYSRIVIKRAADHAP